MLKIALAIYLVAFVFCHYQFKSNDKLSNVHGPGFKYQDPEFKHWPRSQTYHHVRATG